MLVIKNISEDILSCVEHPKPIRTVFGVQRLVTPVLVNMTSEHYGCRAGVTINEFGPVLESKVK